MGDEPTTGDGAATRDDAWFEALFRQHGNRLLAYARRRCPDDADDVVAEVFATAWRHRATVPEDALPWLYRTAAHHVLHAHRGRTRRSALVLRSASVDEPDRSPVDLGERVAGRVDAATAVARVMAVLPPRDAEVLRLWAWEQLSTDEIAYVLVLSPAAVRVRLHRARRRAEALLRGALPDPDPDPDPRRDPAAVPTLVHTPEMEELR